MLLFLAPGCSIFHDLWFHAEDEAVIHDSGNNVVDDCTWFDDPKNCWNAMAQVAAACVPDSGRTGEFTIEPPKEPIDTAAPPLLGDCEYLPTNPSADFVVKFGTPITLPLTRSTLSFTLEGPAGANCASVAFPDGADTLKLTVEGAGVFEQTAGDTAPVYECPDGTTVEPTFSELASCNTGESHVPGVALTSTDTSLTATISGNAGDSIQLFKCLVPEDTGEED